MNLPTNLGPELASLTREDGTVSKAYGGLRYLAGAAFAYFSLSWSEEPVEGLPAYGSARSNGIADFPEFDDIAVLTRSDERGRPVGVEVEGWKLLAIEQTHPPTDFKAETAGALFRISPGEVKTLREDVLAVMKEARDAGGETFVAADITQRGREFFNAWIEAQAERWQADANSAIGAHDLVVFGDAH